MINKISTVFQKGKAYIMSKKNQPVEVNQPDPGTADETLPEQTELTVENTPPIPDAAGIAAATESGFLSANAPVSIPQLSVDPAFDDGRGREETLAEADAVEYANQQAGIVPAAE